MRCFFTEIYVYTTLKKKLEPNSPLAVSQVVFVEYDEDIRKHNTLGIF